MKNLKRYRQLFESTEDLTQEQKDWLDRCTIDFYDDTIGTWKVNSQTGLVDVDGDFHCNNMRLNDLKGVRFGKVTGNFWCSRNNLTSLAGCPQEVGGTFNCYGNELSTLDGSPKKVTSTFDCSENELVSLKGISGVIGGSFYCHRNNLTSLEGLPNDLKIGGDFDCSKNKLKSFKGASNLVVKNLDCSDNNLTSLDGAPVAMGQIIASDNPISRGMITRVLRMRGLGRTIEVAVHSLWGDTPDEDRIYLAKHHPTLPEDEKNIYRAMEINMKRR